MSYMKNILNLPDDILYIIMRKIDDYLSTIIFLKWTSKQLRKMPIKLESLGHINTFMILSPHKDAIMRSIPITLQYYINFIIIPLNYSSYNELFIFKLPYPLYIYQDNVKYRYNGLSWTSEFSQKQLYFSINKYIWNINRGTIKELIIDYNRL